MQNKKFHIFGILVGILLVVGFCIYKSPQWEKKYYAWCGHNLKKEICEKRIGCQVRQSISDNGQPYDTCWDKYYIVGWHHTIRDFYNQTFIYPAQRKRDEFCAKIYDKNECTKNKKCIWGPSLMDNWGEPPTHYYCQGKR